MFRKKLAPASIRRCAVFLSLAGALALNVGTAHAGLALRQSDDGQAGLTGFDGNRIGSNLVMDHPAAAEVGKSVTPVAKTGAPDVPPGLTGENWFQGLQQSVDHAFDLQDASSATDIHRQSTTVSPLDNGAKPNAIPSLPSFWSGLTCCVALTIAGLFPRVRRVLR
jgi:hypothetical protein